MVLIAEDLMKKLPAPMPSTISVADAAKIMANDQVGYALIADSELILGIVTEWDILYKVVAPGKDPKDVTMGQIMNREVYSAPPETPTMKITKIMNEKGIRRLLVGSNGKYLGIITSKDIIRIFDDYMDNVEEVAEKFGKY
ncbi:MAG: inosine-5'-monophosphate dehydrogenase related protein [Thermoplasmatales archaeon E-plasma]|jgi:IMP dehydrogenase|nr:MAG: inosine-5'-monophosphate dehydrogenase related protein [Thermoplasmatales archaeon E-plasma]